MKPVSLANKTPVKEHKHYKEISMKQNFKQNSPWGQR